MSLRTRCLLFVSTIALVAAGIGKYVAAPRYLLRIPPGWAWESSFIGNLTYADPQTGTFPEKDEVLVTERSLRSRPRDKRSHAAQIQDRYTILHPQSGKKVWDYVLEVHVNAATGMHEDAAHRGDYYVFPRHVSKGTYRLRQSYLKGIPLSFEAEETIDGLNTYVFSYHGPAEYTESYQGSAEFAGVPVAAGQEIRCADDQFFYRIWVEPLSGDTVKVAESCVSGDSIYETRTGKLVKPVARWRGVIAGEDMARLVVKARAERARLLIVEYAPAVLTLLALICASLAFVNPRSLVADR
jgi:hypothetical protein